MKTRVTADRETVMYAQLKEHVLERDQIGASQVFYQLVRAARPLIEILRETVRIHAPYTHVPYHQRLDNGFVRFVNNDHCLLSARASLRLPALLAPAIGYLPMAQTIWYVPTGLDPWNQLLGNMPGHYARQTYNPEAHATVPPPEIHWQDQEPLYFEGPYEERLNHWLTFGHKAYRARATIELGEAIGWDKAHDVVYAGVPDIAVGPRWYSAYEMACQVSWTHLAEEQDKPASSLGPSPRVPGEQRLWGNRLPLTQDEAMELVHTLTQAHEPAYIDAITSLLLAGKEPRQIIDVLQVAAAKVLLETGSPQNFSMPQHGYEYTNTLRWFYDNFEHPHRLKLLYVAGSFINQCALWIQNIPGNGAVDTSVPSGASSRSRDEILKRLDKAMRALKPAESVAWTRAYLAGGYDRQPLVHTLALGAVKQGNDPHNQEIGLCLLEDYLHSTAVDRELLLLACAQHTAGHIKYGGSLEAYQRYMGYAHAKVGGS